jgi:hypothetical protein
MARVAFSSEAEEILGKLAGSVFQDSYIGMQVRGLPRPKNPQTQLQQLRRGNFRLLSSSWRFLTTTEQNTWIFSAGTVPEALRLFIGNNINLILVGIPIINSYTAATTPVNFPVVITELTATTFLFSASGSPTAVPANTRLLIYATSDKQPTLIFDNPSQYTPITLYNAGTDLSSPTDLFTAWTAHYGLMRNIRRICIKAVLISTLNGDRSGDEIACATSPFIATSDVIDSDGTFVIDSDGTFITAI